MTEGELLRVQHFIDKATAASRARFEEEMRWADAAREQAENLNADHALVLLNFAQRMLEQRL